MENFGSQNEFELIDAINGKRFNELNTNLKNWLTVMYGSLINSRSIFRAEKCDPRGKPDIHVWYRGVHHFVSVKYGSAEFVHLSDLDKFVGILRDYDIPESAINIYLLCHFGDGTLDGTGKCRKLYYEIYKTMKDDFRKANLLLNNNRNLVVELVDLFVFRGNYEGLETADYMYHGDVYHGVLVSRKLMLSHVKRRTYDYMHNLHIGPLQFVPYARYVDKQGLHPEKRYKVNIKWVNLKGDMQYINDYYV